MKAKYASKEPCWLCGLPWAPGAPIANWLGDWVHGGCKAARAASVASEGVRTELPDARGWADKPKQVSSRTIRGTPGGTKYSTVIGEGGL